LIEATFHMLKKLISDGKSDISKGIIDAAKRLEVQHEEAASTYRNIANSDGTLILTHSYFSISSFALRTLAGLKGKPSFHINVNMMRLNENITTVRSWIIDKGIETLNVTGSDKNVDGDIFKFSEFLIEGVILLDLIKADPSDLLTNHDANDYLAEMPIEKKAVHRVMEDSSVDSIIDDLDLDVQVMIANLEFEDAQMLQLVFGKYIVSKVGQDYEPDDDVMTKIWKQLRETHRLRLVK